MSLLKKPPLMSRGAWARQRWLRIWPSGRSWPGPAREDMAAVVYRHTEDHPLFMLQMVGTRWRSKAGSRPPLMAARAALGRGVPGSEEHSIWRGRRGCGDLLGGATGAIGGHGTAGVRGGQVWPRGQEFRPWLVWRPGCKATPEAVETACEALARGRGSSWRIGGLTEWPDRTEVSGRYGWRHPPLSGGGISAPGGGAPGTRAGIDRWGRGWRQA